MTGVASRVKSPAAAASSPAVSSVRQCSSRLRRRAISSRTGLTTLRVISTENPIATSSETPSTIRSRRAWARSSASTAAAVASVSASTERWSATSVVKSSSISGSIEPL